MVNCEECMNYYYDDEGEYYTCSVQLDEDEMCAFMSGKFRDCPYYRRGDEYTMIRHSYYRHGK